MDDLINKVHCLEFSEMCEQLPDQSVDMILCDLPYGTTACSWDSVIPFDRVWLHFKRIIKPRGAIVLTASQPFTSALVMSNPDWFKYSWVWEKVLSTQFLDANRRPLKKHEDVLVFANGQTMYNPQMGVGEAYSTNPKSPPTGIYHNHYRVPTINSRYPNTIIKFTNERGYHPTQKPVALFEYLIRTYTQEGELVFDPCVGSGTTALACQRTGRNFICSDFTQEYVDIANERLQRADPY